MSAGSIPPNISSVLNSAPFSGTETLVRIISLPTALQTLPQNIKLTGEVTQTNPDGTARVQTPQGEVVVQYPPRRLPVEGQKLDIELPAGNPPQKAAVRANAPPPDTRLPQSDLPDIPTQPTTPRPTDRVSIQPPQQSPQPQQPTPQTPVTPQQQAALDAVKAAIRATAPQIIDIGAIVRLSPVSLAKLQMIIKAAETLVAKGALTPEQFSALVKSLTPTTAPIQTAAAPTTQAQATPLNTTPALQTLFSDDGAFQLQSILPALQTILTQVTGDDVTTDFVKVLLAKFATTPATTLTTPAFDDGVDVQIIRIGTQQTTPLQPAPISVSDLPDQISLPPAPTLQNIRIIGLTVENFPIISAQISSDAAPDIFILQAASPKLSLGAEIDLVPVAVQSFTPLIPLITTPRGFDWSGLDQIFKALLGFDLATQQGLTTPLTARAPLPLPNIAIPQQLGPAALLFLAALRSGDIASWLGDKNIEALKRANKIDLLGKLTDTTTRARTASAEPVGDWRVQHFPMTYQGQILPLSIFYRQQQDENAKDGDGGKKQTRFIIDLNLTRMGDVQVDGLVRDKKLDVIIRTQAQLSDAMATEMKKLYAGAINQTSFTGELSFQSRPDQFVKIDDSGPKSAVGVNA